jgi:hypothetical protein
MHGTIELRLFPAFEKEKVHLYFSAVQCFVDAAEAFLKREEERQSLRTRYRLDITRPVRRIA